MASSNTTPTEEEGIILYGDSFFHDVPEGCIASIISFMTLADVCRLSLVSRQFKSASESDVIWERFLPSDYDIVVSGSDGGEALLTEFRTKKKQLYMWLADHPLLVDGGSKSFQLEKKSGKKCWMISAKSLNITWSDTPIHWQWTSDPQSRFSQVAELLDVRWLEISCKILTSMLSPTTQYASYLIFKTTDDAYGLDEASEASIRNSRGETNTRRVYLDAYYEQKLQIRKDTLGWFPSVRVYNNVIGPGWYDQFRRQRVDGWREVKIGEFFVEAEEEDGEVEMVVKEVGSLNWKKGLVVEGIEIRPTLTLR